MTSPLRLEVLQRLASVAPDSWNRLLLPLDRPLLSWEFLEAFERSGCVGGSTGWHPLHVLLWRTDLGGPDQLVAAAPCYLKYDSDGEWVFDLDWAAFAASHGIAYYPKLVAAVPFSPVTGGRLLCKPQLPDEERQVLQRALLEALWQTVHGAKLSSCHLLFPRMLDSLSVDLRHCGFLLRRQEQYHFLNPGYRSFDDFLHNLRGHRRTSIRRERRALQDAGIRVQTYSGLDQSAGFSRAQLDTMFDMYCGTSLRYTGALPYLNRAFFHLAAERLGSQLELVLAHGPGGQVLAGAWNLRSETRLYGRYWGHAPDVHIPFLHFEVCYYHSIERCIAEGLAAFEPGHGGDHKLLRGFTPVYTHSAHYLREPALKQPIAAFLRDEDHWVESALKEALDRCPIRLHHEPGPK